VIAACAVAGGDRSSPGLSWEAMTLITRAGDSLCVADLDHPVARLSGLDQPGSPS
jgi:hypothetical protein